MSGHVWTCLLSLMLSCDVWISPVEGALPYAEAPSTLLHCCLQHLLPTCAEYKFHFQTLWRAFFSVGPPTPHCSDCLHSSLLRSSCWTWRWSEGTSPGFRMQSRQGSSWHQPFHMSSPCSTYPFKLTMMSYLFLMPLFVHLPNALSLLGVIIVFFFRDEKKEGVATQKWFMSHNDSRGKSV